MQVEGSALIKWLKCLMSGRRAIKAGFTERDTIGELDCEYLDSHDCRKEIFQLFLFMTRASPWFGNHDVNLYSPQLNPPPRRLSAPSRRIFFHFISENQSELFGTGGEC